MFKRQSSDCLLNKIYFKFNSFSIAVIYTQIQSRFAALDNSSIGG